MWTPFTFWTGAENLTLNGIRSSDLSAILAHLQGVELFVRVLVIISDKW